MESADAKRAENNTSDLAQTMYAEGEQVRAKFGDEIQAANSFYTDYLDFVQTMAPPSTKRPFLLDVGCGCGWSSYFLASQGYDTVGMDLNPNAFEPQPNEHLSFHAGSALEIPFPDREFDIVSTYQCLEHVPDPRRALEEMARVLKPGGTLIVVGPNLVSPYLALKFLPDSLKDRKSWRRRPTTQRHPYGNTPWEIISSFFWSSALLLRKLFAKTEEFTMRVPDSVTPFQADNDACYLCNPMDLIKYFRHRGFTEISIGKPGRPPGSFLFAGGTWVAFKKPPTGEIKPQLT